MTELARREWCSDHRPRNAGQIPYCKVFPPGETMRCIRVRRRSNGRYEICGHRLGKAPSWVSKAVVALIPLPPIPHSERRVQTCGSCHKSADVYLVRGQELRATG